MKRYIGIAIFATGVALLVNSKQLSEILDGVVYVNTDPLVALTPTVDFGTRRQHETIKSSLKVQNVSSDTITITAVSKSCSCSESTMDRSVLLPKEIGTIEASWNTQESVGDISTAITVQYETHTDGMHDLNDIAITLACKVEPDFVASPNTIDVSIPTREHFVEVMSCHKGESLSLGSVLSTIPQIECSVVGNKVRVTTNESVDKKRVESEKHSVLIEISGTKSRWLKVPVVWGQQRTTK